MLPGYHCPKCGAPLLGNGRLGQPVTCACGQQIPRGLADKARRYWIFQAALPYGAATFFIALALWHARLPADPWARFLSPVLIAPSVASIVLAYRRLMEKKRDSDDDALLLRYFALGMALAGVCLLAALVAGRF
ncbi:hypothetical protein [Methylomagnum sp.]